MPDIHSLKLGQERVYDKLFLLKGECVYIAGALLKNSDGVPKLQILICYNHPETAVATYKQRRQIETCFCAIKSSGFNIEDTHLRDIDRIARLTAMACMALVWAYLVGEHKDMNVKAIRILKNGKSAKSLVKFGLEEMAQAGMSVHENFRKVLTLWYENLRSVLAVPSGRIGRAV